MNKTLVALAASALIFPTAVSSAVVAQASTLNSSFQVLANVAPTPVACNPSFSVNTVDFGTLTPVPGPAGFVLPQTYASSIIAVNCSSGVGYSIMMAPGNAGTQSSSPSGRYMINGSNRLAYQILAYANHSTVSAYSGYAGCQADATWGDGTNGTSYEVSTGAGSTQSWAVCLAVPQQAVPAPGTYSDTIIASLNF